MTHYVYKQALSEERSEQLGRELFELWNELGTMTKATLEFDRRNPDLIHSQTSVNAHRARSWFVRHPEEGFDIILKYKPDTPRFAMEQKVIMYIHRYLRSNDTFIAWLEEHPWAKKYEYYYKEFYVLP